MNILIVNQPLNNRGDESAHKALLRTIVKKIPNVKIKVLFLGPRTNTIEQFDVHLPQVDYVCVRGLKCGPFFIPPMKKNKLWMWFLHPSILRIQLIYRWADQVICAPGGICMGGFQNWGHMFFLKMAQFTRKPLVYYGRSFGPFPTETEDNKLFKKISLEMLNYFSFLSIRDTKSEKLAKELGLKKIETTVDSAFLDSPHVPIPSEIKQQIGSTPYLVFVPNLLIWHYAYKGKATLQDVLLFYSKILEMIVDKYPNHKIVMLPQTFDYGTYDGDDIHFFNDLKKHTGNENIIVIPDCYSSDIQQTIVSKAALVVGARYHSVVFALNQAIPFVALSYEHKINGLLENLGKLDCLVDITNIFNKPDEINTILKKFSNCLNNTKSDTFAQRRAKEKALSCFNKYVSEML